MAETKRCYRHPDRETGLSCSECGRPICVDCMTVAPVGIRCPDHSGQPRGVQKMVKPVRRAAYEGSGAVVTKALVAINVLIYLIQLGQGAGIQADAGEIFYRGALYGPLVADGEWWRLITAAFLHLGPLHLAMNMLALWWLGGPVELALGRGRFILLYLVSGLAGSAGALLLDPRAVTVGASGAIFGIMGAGMILEYLATRSFAGQYMTIIAINLVISVTLSSHISLGGHVGGLVGGALGTLALARFGRGHAAYGRLGAIGVGGVVLVGVLSVVIAVARAHSLT